MKHIIDETPFLETKISSEQTFDGKVLRVFRDEIALPNGKTSVREYAKHRGAVAVGAIHGEDNVYLVRQYRYAIARTTLEIPAGKLEASDTDPEAAAKRELSEEIGATAGKFSSLGVYLASPAILTEKIYCYLAEELTFGEMHPDEDENLATLRIPLKEAVACIERGEWEDGKTVFGILKAYLKKKGSLCDANAW